VYAVIAGAASAEEAGVKDTRYAVAMNDALPETINVLLIGPRDDPRRDRVEAVAPGRIRVTELPGQEIALDGGTIWPVDRGRALEPVSTREERDAMLAEAHIILIGLPYPTTLVPRMPNLRWAHLPNAGASNLHSSDLWGSGVMVTTARGSNAAEPIAESAIAGVVMFARGLDRGARGGSRRRDYRGLVSFGGKTLAVIGLGGIGAHTARLARGLGMRVIATRRSATTRQENVDGVDELFPADELHAVLGQADFVVIAVMHTAETENMFDAAAFAAMKDGVIIANVARGEVIDEAALLAALDSGKVSGAYLDVYAGELSGEQVQPALRDHPRVVFTPHITWMSDNQGRVGFDVFLDNLQRFLAGEELENVVDWARGY
jgi:phosphoglycerate dehydrogenase-like enzyme